MSWVDHLPLAVFLRWLRNVLSEADGTPSASRFLMLLFSMFSMMVIGWIVYYITHITDVMIIGTYLANLPLLITSLLGLIALPYGINKGSSTFSDIANMMTAAKTGKAGVVQAVEAQIEQAVASAIPASAAKPTPAVGTPGVKG